MIFFVLEHGTEVDYTNEENLLGFHLDLYARYSEALKVKWHAGSNVSLHFTGKGFLLLYNDQMFQ